MNMPRATAVVACGLALASCSSLSSSFDQFAQPNAAILTINSAPPGAEARLSTGGNCRTPCMLSVSAADEFTVTYTLDGYMSQTISVRSIPPVKRALIDLTPPSLDPNPVFVTLEPAPPPKPPPVKRQQRSQSPPIAPAKRFHSYGRLRSARMDASATAPSVGIQPATAASVTTGAVIELPIGSTIICMTDDGLRAFCRTTASKRSANELFSGIGAASIRLALLVRGQSSALTSANEIDKLLRLRMFRSKVDCNFRVSTESFFTAMSYR
jgi:hypothetical protein